MVYYCSFSDIYEELKNCFYNSLRHLKYRTKTEAKNKSKYEDGSQGSKSICSKRQNDYLARKKSGTWRTVVPNLEYHDHIKIIQGVKERQQQQQHDVKSGAKVKPLISRKR